MIGHPHQWYGAISYAQHGEGMAVLNIFKRLGVERGTYVDVGAHHPFELSNTALLYMRGWRGVNVEANPDLITAFHDHRPHDRNVHAAIVGESSIKRTRLYRVERTSGINSTVRANVVTHGIMDTVEVPAMTLSQIIREYCDGRWPNFLSIDAEGQDLSILHSLPHDISTELICVEAVSPGRDDTESMREWARGRDYFVHSWCGHNMMLVRASLRDAIC